MLKISKNERKEGIIRREGIRTGRVERGISHTKERKQVQVPYTSVILQGVVWNNGVIKLQSEVHELSKISENARY